jgi:hypothetical protein
MFVKRNCDLLDPDYNVAREHTFYRQCREMARPIKGIIHDYCVCGLTAARVSTAMLLAALLYPSCAAAQTTVTVKAGSVTCNYTRTSAADLGDFVGNHFTMHKFLATDPNCPLRVYFDPDSDGKRDEVVFELGRFDAPSNWADYGPYTVTITSPNAASPVSISIQKHYWMSRWRWQSAARPKTADYESLVRKGLLPAIDPTKAGAPRSTSAAPFAPMGLGSVTDYMPTTGERDDLGLLPEWWSQAIAGNTVAERQSFANAEAAGTFPWHIRDETGSPLSIDRHPDVAIDSRFSKAIAGDSPGAASPTIVIDHNHWPSLSYVAFLVTGDPYFLEELQFQANYVLFEQGSHNRQGLIPIWQVRGWAWGVRELFYAAAATPGSGSTWLLPQIYFQQKLKNNLQYSLLPAVVDNKDPATQAFRFALGLSYNQEYDTWQNDYLVAVLGQAVRMGFKEWEPAFNWFLKGVIDRVSPTSGWNQAVPSPYEIKVKGNPPPVTWAQLVAAQGWPKSVSGPAANGVLDPHQDQNYASYLMGVLEQAVSLGHAEAQPGLKWLAPQVTHAYYKWAFSSASAPKVSAQPVVSASQ